MTSAEGAKRSGSTWFSSKFYGRSEVLSVRAIIPSKTLLLVECEPTEALDGYKVWWHHWLVALAYSMEAGRVGRLLGLGIWQQTDIMPSPQWLGNLRGTVTSSFDEGARVLWIDYDLELESNPKEYRFGGCARVDLSGAVTECPGWIELGSEVAAPKKR